MGKAYLVVFGGVDLTFFTDHWGVAQNTIMNVNTSGSVIFTP